MFKTLSNGCQDVLMRFHGLLVCLLSVTPLASSLQVLCIFWPGLGCWAFYGGETCDGQDFANTPYNTFHANRFFELKFIIRRIVFVFGQLHIGYLMPYIVKVRLKPVKDYVHGM